MRYSQFCDVDCDVTLLRIGENDRFCAATRRCSAKRSILANASEVRSTKELHRHSQSSPLTTSHTIRPIHTQEVTGSSPVAPTIQSGSIDHQPLRSRTFLISAPRSSE